MLASFDKFLAASDKNLLIALPRLPHSICLLLPYPRSGYLGEAMDISDYLMGIIVVLVPSMFGVAYLIIHALKTRD
jgi:hypothetical protein